MNHLSGLQLNVGEYMVTSKFIVSSLWSFDGDIILGLPWIKTLGTFILNAEKKFLTFSYNRKRITFQDITMKSEIEPPTSEEFQDISNMISQGNQKSEQMKQEEVEKIVTSKDEEITRLKNHSQDLIAQIKKLKDESDFNQRLTNQDIKKEISDYEVETIRLNKIVNNKDEVLTQIRKKLEDR